jgi:hypothetical protein
MAAKKEAYLARLRRIALRVEEEAVEEMLRAPERRKTANRARRAFSQGGRFVSGGLPDTNRSRH